ncbi:MAG: DNA primase noncatalytic subunit PriX [Thermoproteota archaeon]|nr:DNA primase noncatalytic subunit PriX [Thermoproteota archaeon]
MFIDLDTEHFRSKEELDRWLKRILRNIASVLHGVKPLILWSGNGYHIIVPVKATEALEQFDDFEPYTTEPSKEFLQFAARQLSLNKSDTLNSPAFKSCLLRVPYIFNSKYLEEQGIDPDVKVIQQWDSSQSLPEIDNLLVEFQTLLVDRKLKAEINNQKKILRRNDVNSFHNTANTIPYVEKLLNMRIDNYRKFAISLILAPYFVNIQYLSEANAFNKIREWVLKCNEIRKLDPSIVYFDELIKSAIERAENTHFKPLKFEETLRYKNKALYDILR